MFEILLLPKTYIDLGILTALEIVLNIDNIIFISIVVSKLDKTIQNKIRIIGLFFAFFFRILLLGSLSWISSLTKPIISIINFDITGRGLILIGGGLFLIIKSSKEIKGMLKVQTEEKQFVAKSKNSNWAILEIILIDIIFSLDSIFTAIGVSNQSFTMVSSIIIGMIYMGVASKQISNFVDRYPTLKVLALSFLVMVGVVLVADGTNHHIPKPYIYVAMLFSIVVESINIRLRNLLSKKK